MPYKFRFIIPIMLAGCIGLYIISKFDPSKYAIYPPCLFKKLTGLYCSGCGSTRAVHSLLKFELYQAFRYNSLLVICLPFIVYEVVAIFTAKLPRISTKKWVIIVLAILAIIYWIGRNIPLYPFTLLAPTKLF